MGTIQLRKGVNPVVFLGASAVAFNTLAWITTANIVKIFAVSSTGAGLTAYDPARPTLGPQSFAPVTDGTISGYIITTKVAIPVDAALFAPSVAPAVTQLAAPTGYQASPLPASPTTALSVTASSVANAASYRLYTSATQMGAYAQLGGVLTSPTYNHAGLNPAQTQWYKWQTVGDGTTYSDSPIGAAFSGVTNTTAAGVVLAANEVAMIALYGQSNELSNADKAALPYEPLSTWAGDVAQVFANVRILNTSTMNLEALHDGVNTRPAENNSYPTPVSYHTSDAGVWLVGSSSAQYNFEVITRCYFIAKRFKESYPNSQLVIVQGAVGGVPRSRFLKTNNDLYQRFGNMITRAKQVIVAEGKTVRFLAIDCTQGETDQATAVSTFNAQLRQIWSDLQADYATSETQFIEFGIPPTGDTGTYVVNPHNPTKATWANEDPRRRYIDPGFVALEEDRIHWNAASQAYAAYNVFAIAFQQSLSFPASTTPASPAIAYNATSGVVTITPPTAAWLKREFYYQIGSATPVQLINTWAVNLPATVQAGDFKVYSRAVPGRNQSPTVSNPAVWTLPTRAKVNSGLIQWLPARGAYENGNPRNVVTGNVISHSPNTSGSWSNYAPASFRLKKLPATQTCEVLRVAYPNLTRATAGVVAGIATSNAPTVGRDALLGLYQDTNVVAQTIGSGLLSDNGFTYSEPIGNVYHVIIANGDGTGTSRLINDAGTDIAASAQIDLSDELYYHVSLYGPAGSAAGNTQASSIDSAYVTSDYIEVAFL